MSKERQELDVEALNQELCKELESSERDESAQENRKHHRRHRKKKKIRMTPFRVMVVILCVILILLATAVAAFGIMRSRGKKGLQTEKVETVISAPEEAEMAEEGKYVVYNGERYCYNENVISILCMGIDTSITETSDDNIGENSQADALILVVLDSETGEMSLINISRDSMVDVNKYNVEGKYLGTEKMQICLSYAYGDGKEKSCLNTAESVSRLMYGMPIHAYAAIDYDAISLLNDAVGGVTVTVLEDLSGKDPALQEGAEVTLDGQQAHTYVRTRDIELLDSNNMRMARQKQYLLSFVQTALAKTREDIGVPLTLYQTASDYMVTDVGASEVTYLASLVLQQGVSESAIRSVPGEVIKGEIYAEFIPDDQGLYELILDVFYNKVDMQ